MDNVTYTAYPFRIRKPKRCVQFSLISLGSRQVNLVDHNQDTARCNKQLHPVRLFLNSTTCYTLIIKGLLAILAYKIVREILNYFARDRILNFRYLRLTLIRIILDVILRSKIFMVKEIACSS